MLCHHQVTGRDSIVEKFAFIGDHTGAIIKVQGRVIFSAVRQKHLLLLEQPQTAHIVARFDTLQSSLKREGEDHDSEPKSGPEIHNDSDSGTEPEPEI